MIDLIIEGLEVILYLLVGALIFAELLLNGFSCRIIVALLAVIAIKWFLNQIKKEEE